MTVRGGACGENLRLQLVQMRLSAAQGGPSGQFLHFFVTIWALTALKIAKFSDIFQYLFSFSVIDLVHEDLSCEKMSTWCVVKPSCSFLSNKYDFSKFFEVSGSSSAFFATRFDHRLHLR